MKQRYKYKPVICLVTLFMCFTAITAIKLNSFKLKWNKVTRANGYQIEYKKIKSTSRATVTKTTTTTTNHVLLKLPAAKYQLRIAGLNKFGRPGPFSNWKYFTITKSNRDKKIIDLDQKEKKVTKIISINNQEQFDFEWQMFIPGWTHYRRNQAWKSYTYWATFSSLIGFGVYHTLSANSLANDPLNNSDVLISSLVGKSLDEVIIAQDKLNTHKTNYQQHVNWQYNIGYISIAVYAFYWLDLWLFTPSKTTKTRLHPPSKNKLSFTFNLNKFDPLLPNNHIISLRLKQWF